MRTRPFFLNQTSPDYVYLGENVGGVEALIIVVGLDDAVDCVVVLVAKGGPPRADAGGCCSHVTTKTPAHHGVGQARRITHLKQQDKWNIRKIRSDEDPKYLCLVNPQLECESGCLKLRRYQQLFVKHGNLVKEKCIILSSRFSCHIKLSWQLS